MKKLVFLLAAITSFSVMAQRHYPGPRGPIGPQGNQRLQIHLNQHLIGQQVLPIKMLLKQQYPYMNLQAQDLKAVVVVGKSMHGMGTVTLKVGQNHSYPETLRGVPFQFHNPAPHTFSRVRIQSPSYNDLGVWQLLTRGNIKIQKIVVVIAPKYVVQPRRPGRVIVRPAPRRPGRVVVRPAPGRQGPVVVRPGPRRRY